MTPTATPDALPLLRGAALAAAFALGAAATASAVDRREVGALILEDIPEIPAELTERLLQYQNMRGASLADWLPDGEGLLIRTRFAETTQLHAVAFPGGARRQITFFPEPVGGGSFPNTGEREFLFSMDSGGNEVSQLFLFDMETGRARMVSDGEARHGGGLWANTTASFAFTNNARNGRDFDIYLREPGDAPGESRMVFESAGSWGPVDFAPDDSRLLISQYISVNETTLHILDLESGETTQVNPNAEGPVRYGAARFSANGDAIFYTSDEGSEFRQLRYAELRHGVTTTLVDDIEWDVESFTLSDDGSRLVFSVNAGGKSELYLLDTESLERTPIDLPMGIIGGMRFHPDGDRIAFSLSTPTAPTEVYTYSFDDQELVRWTYSETGGLPPGMFVAPEIIRYPTFDTHENGDRRMIPALVYRPRTEGPWPVIINIHGGPESQSRPFFGSLTQFYVNELDAAVIFPNVRGSTGYGKTFVQLDNGMLREDSVRDIGALLDWIELQPDLDESRVAVIGGSYGGYMVLASLVHFSDRLAAGVSSVGISNFVTFLESTAEYRRDLRRVEYGDERDPEMRAFLESISPSNNADRIRAPLMVAQGFNDPRVPYTESEQIVEAVRANGFPVWYFLAMNEGHGFARKENRDLYQAAVVLFFEKHLLGRGEADAE